MPMTLVSTVTVGSNTSDIDFTNIPQTAKDLFILASTRSTIDDSVLFMTPNNSFANASNRFLLGNGSTASSSTYTALNYGFIAVNQNSSYAANSFANGSIYISNYASTTNKCASIDLVNTNNATASRLYLTAYLWANTSAITSLRFTHDNGQFAVGTTISLYTIS